MHTHVLVQVGSSRFLGMHCEDTAVPSSDSGVELPVDDEFVATDIGLDAEKRKRKDKNTTTYHLFSMKWKKSAPWLNCKLTKTLQAS